MDLTCQPRVSLELLKGLMSGGTATHPAACCEKRTETVMHLRVLRSFPSLIKGPIKFGD
jgi:hypothetical protein